MSTVNSSSADRKAPLDWPALLAHRQPLVMGVLNVTPDSFSDGGQFFDPQQAIRHATRMVAEGADLIDIGAESTRPYDGQTPVSAEDEIARLAPVLAAIASLDVPISVDTMKARVAGWALDRGASIVNDVWGLQDDPDMADLIAARNVPAVLMHNRHKAEPDIDIMADIDTFFRNTLDIARRAGIRPEMIALDPGIGFGKTPEQSILVLGRLRELARYDLPLLVGASRKRFIASVVPSEPHDRLGGSIASHLLATLDGAAVVRVHDVAETVQALRVAQAIRSAQ